MDTDSGDKKSVTLDELIKKYKVAQSTMCIELLEMSNWKILKGTI